MMTLLLAADAPPTTTRVFNKPLSMPPEFGSDAERCAWIAAEYKRQHVLNRGVNRAKIARDIAATAFGISINDLCGLSRKTMYREPRQKIACIILLLTSCSTTMAGQQVGRHYATVIHAFKKYGAEIKRILINCGAL